MDSNNSVDPLSKYIFLNFNFGAPSKSYYVYTLTVSSDDENQKAIPQTSPSTSSVTSKKSIGGKAFSKWINRALRKRKATDEYPIDETLAEHIITEQLYISENEPNDKVPYSTTTTTKQITSKSRIPVHKFFSLKKNFQKSTCVETLASSDDCGRSQSYVNVTPCKKTAKPLKKSISDIKIESLGRSSVFTDTTMPLYKMEVLNLNSKLAVDIHKISFLLSQLKESETYVANIVSRYFQDVTVKTHLLDALKSYSKLHFNADLRTHNLTNEMCLYQNDVLKNQENSLQHRINSVIKNNRLLLIKIDELTNQNEKLCISVQQLPENTRHISDSALLDRMNNSNDKLRSKVRLLYDELERQEVECCKLQKNHALLGKQLQNTNLQLQNYRGEFSERNITRFQPYAADIVRRVETDNKLEHEHLLNELQNSQRIWIA
ncbi:hypothetical protein FQA39_LY05554 [Lamprigera yunnana]|nr:hypothetical protein FQA39_LY05554 [Lamprigera yunnana]